MRIQLTIIGTALLALPLSGQAQSGITTETGVSARAESSRSGSNPRAEAVLHATAAADLPEAPVRRAIAEGEAKGASPAAVERAALSAHTRLRIAREALAREGKEARRPSDAEIVAGAEAMASGAASTELVTIRDAAPARRDLAASLNVLASLHARGFHGGEAASAIAARLKAGASDTVISSAAATARSAAELGLVSSVGATGSLDAGAGLGGVVGGLGTAAGLGAGITGSVGGGLIR
ncbi:MAG: hypothetical protein KY464_03840 [Gemmatimonadetes bacterium]|nr:hypothetical protein [Gemmatimonadota bacterium]